MYLHWVEFLPKWSTSITKIFWDASRYLIKYMTWHLFWHKAFSCYLANWRIKSYLYLILWHPQHKQIHYSSFPTGNIFYQGNNFWFPIHRAYYCTMVSLNWKVDVLEDCFSALLSHMQSPVWYLGIKCWALLFGIIKWVLVPWACAYVT